MNEFDFIKTYLAPLAGPEGLGLKDDAALFKPNSGKDLVLTKDTMVEGVHFPQGHYGGDTAGKLLRVNLSDLAAKGARPIGYMLSIAWPKNIDSAFYNQFAKGLLEMQDAYDFKLFGGDTVSIDGPMVVTATIIGEVPIGKMIMRSGANIEDDVWVTGTIGDAYLGLQQVLGRRLNPHPCPEALGYFETAYYRPEPRLLFRQFLCQYASACVDISDGFVADAAHLSAASHVALKCELQKIPLSKHAQDWLAAQPEYLAAMKTLITAGDDYELIFTARPDKEVVLRYEAAKIGLPISKIGKAEKGQGVVCLDRNGKAITFTRAGHTHF